MRDVGGSSASIRYQPAPDITSRAGTPWLAIVLGLALAAGVGVWLYNVAEENSRANAELREQSAQKKADRERAQQQTAQPQVIFVPQAAPSGPSPERRGESIPAPDSSVVQAQWQHLAVAPPPSPAALAPTPAPVAPQPTPPSKSDESERQWRQRIDDAKVTYESLFAAVQQECPELKPGDIRLDVAEHSCVQLRAEMRIALARYEAAKRGALAAGFMIS